MIVTVTMNPAVDRTVSIESLHRGGLNRIQKAESDAGGKGINVSKTLKVLGADSTATGFLAGTAGKKIEEQLKIQGIQTDFLWIEGETRTNTKVQEIGGCVTEFNEPGPEVSEEDRNKLLEKLEDYAGENVLFVLAGSLQGEYRMDFTEKSFEESTKKAPKCSWMRMENGSDQAVRQGRKSSSQTKKNCWNTQESPGVFL